MTKLGDMDAKSSAQIPNSLVLAASIFISTLILSASVLMVGNSITTELSKISGLALAPANTGGTGTQQQNVPSPAQAAPSPEPAAPEISLKTVSGNASGVMGEDNAPITIVEFSDFQCPFCRRHYTETHRQLIDNYVKTGKARLIFKDLPLDFHPSAAMAANAARCGAEQGKFWEAHDAIFDMQQAKDPGGGTVQFSAQDVKDTVAKISGIDATKFNSCVDSSKYASDVKASYTEGFSIGINGTPSFVIGPTNGNGQIVVGAQPYATFQAVIDGYLG